MKLPRVITTLIALGTLAFGAQSAFAGAEPFLGEIEIVGFNFAPTGWAMCQGQTLPISQNTALFSLLGTTYGGNGYQTFQLPDLQGRVPIGQGNGNGLSQRIMGEIGGAETHTLTVNELPAHSHPIVASTNEASLTSPTGNVMANKARVPLYDAIPTSGGTTMAPTASAGGNQPHSIMQPYLVVNYIIALEGIYPSRN